MERRKEERGIRRRWREEIWRRGGDGKWSPEDVRRGNKEGRGSWKE